ncbi:hypothetical protein QQF64_011737 [Cirrhinus molitorella]|uniref:Uncharacterized protein n=1 Tax=Cirrhinus molitorella TaxID=172907 RepID=A0ABR3LTF7_9TELE
MDEIGYALPSEASALCNKSRNIAKDESLALRMPPDSRVHAHPLLLSPEGRMLQLNPCKSVRIPSTRPAICVCRGGGPVSVLDQTSAQIRESVGRAVVTPLQVPEESRIREHAHSPPSLRRRGSDSGLQLSMVHLWLALLLIAHNVGGDAWNSLSVVQ